MLATTTIPTLHSEHRVWTNELNFFKDEIKIFERRLAAVANRNEGLTVTAQVEHFQNRFIREKEVIDELKHNLSLNERQLAGFVKELNGLGLQSIRMDSHAKLRNDMQTHRKLYTELKNEFRRFEAFCLC